MTRNAAALLAAVILLAGCARRPPAVQHDPELTLPAAWAAGAGGTVQDAWWETFDDAGLTAAVGRALEGNRDLRAAAWRVEAATVEARIAGADLLPGDSAGFSGSRRRQNFIGLPIPGSESRVLSTTSTTLGASVNVSWEADLWGRIRAGEVAALAAAESQAAAYAASRLSLAAQLSKAWFALAETAQQLELAERTLDSYHTSTEWIRIRFEAGLRPSIDLRLALTNVSAAEALVAQRREQLQRLLRQLEVLQGDYPGGRLTPPGSLPELPPAPPAGMPAEVLARRPDLLAAERALLAADARVAQSRAALYPSLNLTGSVGTSSRTLIDLLDGDFGVWSLLGGLTQPLFQAGRLRSNVELSRLRSREALEAWAAQVLRALAEVESALAAEQHLQRQLEQFQEAAAQTRAALELSEQRYRRGVGDVLTVLESQRRLLESETRTLTVRRLLLDNRVDLHLALGGGFAPAERNLPDADIVTEVLP